MYVEQCQNEFWLLGSNTISDGAHKENKQMILGSLITNLTIRLGLLNLDEDKNLHVA